MYRHGFMIQYKLKLHIWDTLSRLNDNDEKKKLALSLSFRTEVRSERDIAVKDEYLQALANRLTYVYHKSKIAFPIVIGR